MPYKPELVEILLQKVSNILNQKMNSKNPVFMAHVITDIAYYLSQYANKNPDSINRNQTAKALKQKLKKTNAVLQGKLNVTDLEKKWQQNKHDNYIARLKTCSEKCKMTINITGANKTNLYY